MREKDEGIFGMDNPPGMREKDLEILLRIFVRCPSGTRKRTSDTHKGNSINHCTLPVQVDPLSCEVGINFRIVTVAKNGKYAIIISPHRTDNARRFLFPTKVREISYQQNNVRSREILRGRTQLVKVVVNVTEGHNNHTHAPQSYTNSDLRNIT